MSVLDLAHQELGRHLNGLKTQQKQMDGRD